MSEISTLISLIETAIKEKTIDKMYNAFLEEALRLGISSYSLNRLIGCIKNKIETPQEGSLAANQIPFIQQITPIKLEPEIRYVDRVVEKIVVKKPKRGCIVGLIIALALSIFFFVFIILGMTSELRFQEETIKSQENQIATINKKIDKIKSALNDSVIYCSPISWSSTNKKHNSSSYIDYNVNVKKDKAAIAFKKLNVKKGDKLRFDYIISSESLFDELSVYAINNTDSTKIFVESGFENGKKLYSFTQGGDVVIRFRYKKDGSVHKGDDVVNISNVSIYTPANVRLQLIKDIIYAKYNKNYEKSF